jgi:CHAD domain-containing protein
MNRAARALRASIGDALRLLSRKPVSGKSVHEARKALKKARAALRLLRPEFGEAAFRAENAALRDAARPLARLRESAALKSAMAKLGESPSPATRLRGGRRSRGFDESIRLLRRSRERSTGPQFTAIGSAALRHGLERIYRRGRKAYAEARKDRSTEALHEWRKQLNYLVNALDILGGKKPRKAEKLTDKLGDDHDLAILFARVRPGTALQQRIGRRRAKLQKRALARGGKIYRRKKPKLISSS